MDKLVINGGKPLKGEVTICGAKNAAIAILPAVLLVNGTCKIENVPDISDVNKYIQVLEELGVKISRPTPTELYIENSKISSTKCLFETCRKMRASYYLLGALLGRYKSVEVPFPGGCDFGSRPIDQHIKGFEALNAQVSTEHGIIKATAKKLIGSSIYLDVVSVGATINMILASVLAEGTTFIENAAKEPHIVDLANFLNTMGANIKGAGTDTIKIIGVKELPGNATYSIIPDQIEAGTFMIAAAATRGDVTITNVIPRHLESISAKLEEAGVKIEESDDSVRVYVPEGTVFKRIAFTALPYPGFPTDMQPQLVTFLSTVPGTSTAREGVWDDRFRYVGELSRMGAKINVEGKLAMIHGVEKLMGASVRATDLRAGAAMIIAGLMADGTTEISDIYHIDRGYENFEDKFVALGGDIHRVQVISDF